MVWLKSSFDALIANWSLVTRKLQRSHHESRRSYLDGIKLERETLILKIWAKMWWWLPINELRSFAEVTKNSFQSFPYRKSADLNWLMTWPWCPFRQIPTWHCETAEKTKTWCGMEPSMAIMPRNHPSQKTLLYQHLAGPFGLVDSAKLPRAKKAKRW